MDSGFSQYEGGLTVFTSSGKVESIPLPSHVTSATHFYTETSTTIFVNDVRGGDKIDRLLKNLTMLAEEGYIVNGRVSVLVLMGEKVWPDAYELRQLDSARLNLFYTYAERLNATVRSVQDKLPIVALDIPYNYLYNVTQREDVSHIFLNREFHANLDQSVPIIKPPDKMAQLEQKLGTEINGTGIKIAITDTGIDKNHPDLEGKVILETSFTPESPMDGFGHGTHVASIAAGTGKASNYQYAGVASGAMLLNAKVLTNDGWGYEEWVIAGVEWAVENSADIISMSLGANINGDGTDPLSLAVDWATSQGVVCAIAAGNAGENGMFSVGTPAVARNVITVGATTKTDEVIYFSSQGPTADNRLKPDVVAPGVNIVAARAHGTSMGRPVDQYYTKASGTSMATPHVAGAAALILQVHPDWTAKMVKAALMESARILNSENLWRQGAGRINVAAAINSTLLVVDSSVSLGTVRTRPANATLTVMNLESEEVHVDLSAIGQVNWTIVNNVHINTTSLNIPAYSNRSVLLSVNVTESDVGGWEEGWLNASSTQQNAVVPFLALLSNYIEVSLTDEDGQTLLASDFILVTYPERRLVQFLGYNEFHSPTTFRMLAKPGNYSIIASLSLIKRLFATPGLPPYDNSRSFMIEKFIQVPQTGGLLVNMSLAGARKCTILTNTTEGDDLVVHSYKQATSGDPYYDEVSGTTRMRWTQVNYWLAADLGPLYIEDLKGPITFYTTDIEHPEKASQMFGLYGSKDLALSTVYLLAWKNYNASIPSIMRPSADDLAKYYMYYDMPETYPVYLAITSYINLMGGTNPNYLNGWTYGLDRSHVVAAGLNATYYLTPEIASYSGRYFMHYVGGGPMLARYPQEFWNIPAPTKGEIGCIHLGDFKIGPYIPGLTVKTAYSGTNSTINLSGDVWANLTWPHEEFGVSPYPFWVPTYHLFVDEKEVAKGRLTRTSPDDPLGIGFWDNVSLSWNVQGQRARLLMEIHGILTISRSSVYQIEFDLNRNSTISPLLNKLLMPLNYTSGETLTLNPELKETVSNLTVQYVFDSGNTWENATPSPQGFAISCFAKKQLGIRFNATDMMDNKYYYYTDPAALSRDIKVDLLEYNDTDILVRFTDVEGGTLGITAVQSDLSGSISTYLTDKQGSVRISKPPRTEKIDVSFPSVGVYGPRIVEFQFRVRGDINCDGIVNINDVVVMAQAYGSRKGDSNWNADADIAPSWGCVDIFDLVMCTSYYGKKW
jgi:serine protease AprX